MEEIWAPNYLCTIARLYPLGFLLLSDKNKPVLSKLPFYSVALQLDLVQLVGFKKKKRVQY